MFERYTEKARRTIFFARYEASQYGSRYIEAPHLVLGLARESPATFLKFGADQESVGRAIGALCTKSPERLATSVDIPLSHPSKRALTYAAEEAERMGHEHIGPEHLLLGVLRENGPEAKALAGLGIELQGVREAFRAGTVEPRDTPLRAARSSSSREAAIAAAISVRRRPSKLNHHANGDLRFATAKVGKPNSASAGAIRSSGR